MDHKTAVRDAVPEDAPRLLSIYGYYVKNTAVTFEYETPSAEEFAGRMKEIMRRYPYLVLEEDGKVRGYAYAGPFHSRAAYGWCCEVTVYLAPDAVKRGFGRMLYEALEEALKAMGILNLYACISDPEEEDAYLTRNSEEFHAHLGYQKNGEFHKCGYKFGRWYGMIWMERFIGEHVDAQPPVKRYPGR